MEIGTNARDGDMQVSKPTPLAPASLYAPTSAREPGLIARLFGATRRTTSTVCREELRRRLCVPCRTAIEAAAGRPPWVRWTMVALFFLQVFIPPSAPAQSLSPPATAGMLETRGAAEDRRRPCRIQRAVLPTRRQRPLRFDCARRRRRAAGLAVRHTEEPSRHRWPNLRRDRFQRNGSWPRAMPLHGRVDSGLQGQDRRPNRVQGPGLSN